MTSATLRVTAIFATLAAAGLVAACDAGKIVPEESALPTATTAAETGTSSNGGATGATRVTTDTTAGSSAAGSTAGQTQEVSITAKDYAFDAPASVPSGLTTLRLKNASQAELHQVSIAKLGAGQTISDFLTTIAMTSTEGMELPTFVAGPQAIAPSDSTSVTTFLEPGDYVMLCFIPSTDGTPHFLKGMVAPLTVADNHAAKVDLPAADTTVSAGEFAFIDAPPATAGKHVFRFENKGKQYHEVVLVELDPGKTAEDFVMAFAPDAPPGPPPGRPMGGVTQASPGSTATFVAELQAGPKYAYICFVTDPASGKLHAQLGMTKEFEVQ